LCYRVVCLSSYFTAFFFYSDAKENAGSIDHDDHIVPCLRYGASTRLCI
ncbi:hypothetical protein T01_1453, partial [Trichinella spiralis]